jgi:hypothetical protein
MPWARVLLFDRFGSNDQARRSIGQPSGAEGGIMAAHAFPPIRTWALEAGNVAGRVLLVDGVDNRRRALAIGLRVGGFEVHEAASAAEALGHEMLSRCEWVVVNPMLPDMYGHELAGCVRMHCRLARVLLVAGRHGSWPPVDGRDSRIRVLEAPLTLRALLDYLQTNA